MSAGKARDHNNIDYSTWRGVPYETSTADAYPSRRCSVANYRVAYSSSGRNGRGCNHRFPVPHLDAVSAVLGIDLRKVGLLYVVDQASFGCTSLELSSAL